MNVWHPGVEQAVEAFDEANDFDLKLIRTHDRARNRGVKSGGVPAGSKDANALHSRKSLWGTSVAPAVPFCSRAQRGTCKIAKQGLHTTKGAVNERVSRTRRTWPRLDNCLCLAAASPRSGWHLLRIALAEQNEAELELRLWLRSPGGFQLPPCLTCRAHFISLQEELAVLFPLSHQTGKQARVVITGAGVIT